MIEFSKFNHTIHVFSLSTVFVLFLISYSLTQAEAATFVLENQNINYEIDGATVMDMQLDPDFIELIIEIDSTNDGLIEISIPRALLDAKFGESDDIFFVIVEVFIGHDSIFIANQSIRMYSARIEFYLFFDIFGYSVKRTTHLCD